MAFRTLQPRSDSGQGLAEYIIIIVLIAIVVLVSVRLFGRATSCQFDVARNEIASVGEDTSGCRVAEADPEPPAPPAAPPPEPPAAPPPPPPPPPPPAAAPPAPPPPPPPTPEPTEAPTPEPTPQPTPQPTPTPMPTPAPTPTPALTPSPTPTKTPSLCYENIPTAPCGFDKARGVCGPINGVDTLTCQPLFKANANGFDAYNTACEGKSEAECLKNSAPGFSYLTNSADCPEC